MVLYSEDSTKILSKLKYYCPPLSYESQHLSF